MDESAPLRRSARKSVVSKTEDVTLTPRKRSVTTPVKAEHGTPSRRTTRVSSATPKKSLAETVSTPKKGLPVLKETDEETPRKRNARKLNGNSDIPKKEDNQTKIPKGTVNGKLAGKGSATSPAEDISADSKKTNVKPEEIEVAEGRPLTRAKRKTLSEKMVSEIKNFECSELKKEKQGTKSINKIDSEKKPEQIIDVTLDSCSALRPKVILSDVLKEANVVEKSGKGHEYKESETNDMFKSNSPIKAEEISISTPRRVSENCKSSSESSLKSNQSKSENVKKSPVASDESTQSPNKSKCGGSARKYLEFESESPSKPDEEAAKSPISGTIIDIGTPDKLLNSKEDDESALTSLKICDSTKDESLTSSEYVTLQLETITEISEPTLPYNDQQCNKSQESLMDTFLIKGRAEDRKDSPIKLQNERTGQSEITVCEYSSLSDISDQSVINPLASTLQTVAITERDAIDILTPKGSQNKNVDDEQLRSDIYGKLPSSDDDIPENNDLPAESDSSIAENSVIKNDNALKVSPVKLNKKDVAQSETKNIGLNASPLKKSIVINNIGVDPEIEIASDRKSETKNIYENSSFEVNSQSPIESGEKTLVINETDIDTITNVTSNEGVIHLKDQNVCEKQPEDVNDATSQASSTKDCSEKPESSQIPTEDVEQSPGDDEKSFKLDDPAKCLPGTINESHLSIEASAVVDFHGGQGNAKDDDSSPQKRRSLGDSSNETKAKDDSSPRKRRSLEDCSSQAKVEDDSSPKKWRSLEDSNNRTKATEDSGPEKRRSLENFSSPTKATEDSIPKKQKGLEDSSSETKATDDYSPKKGRSLEDFSSPTKTMEDSSPKKQKGLEGSISQKKAEDESSPKKRRSLEDSNNRTKTTEDSGPEKRRSLENFSSPTKATEDSIPKKQKGLEDSSSETKAKDDCSPKKGRSLEDFSSPTKTTEDSSRKGLEESISQTKAEDESSPKKRRSLEDCSSQTKDVEDSSPKKRRSSENCQTKPYIGSPATGDGLSEKNSVQSLSVSHIGSPSRDSQISVKISEFTLTVNNSPSKQKDGINKINTPDGDISMENNCDSDEESTEECKVQSQESVSGVIEVVEASKPDIAAQTDEHGKSDELDVVLLSPKNFLNSDEESVTGDEDKSANKNIESDVIADDFVGGGDEEMKLNGQDKIIESVEATNHDVNSPKIGTIDEVSSQDSYVIDDSDALFMRDLIKKKSEGIAFSKLSSEDSKSSDLEVEFGNSVDDGSYGESPRSNLKIQKPSTVSSDNNESLKKNLIKKSKTVVTDVKSKGKKKLTADSSESDESENKNDSESDEMSGKDFIDFEAEEGEEERSAQDTDLAVTTDASDPLDSDKKRKMSSAIKSYTSDTDRDEEEVSPRTDKKIKLEITMKKCYVKEPVTEKQEISNSSAKKEIKEYTKTGVFIVSSIDKDLEQTKSKSKALRNISNERDLSASRKNVTAKGGFSTSYLDHAVSRGFTVTEMKNTRSNEGRKKLKRKNSQSKTPQFLVMLVLPPKTNLKLVKTALNENGISDIISIDFVSSKVANLRLSTEDSFKKALDLYGKLTINDKPVYTLVPSSF